MPGGASPTQVAVLGAGPVGVVTAAGLAALGHHVTLHDIDPKRVAALARGRLPFHEPGLPALVKKGMSQGRLAIASTVPARGAAVIAFLCVGTPQADDGAADLTMLHQAAQGALPVIARGGILVIRSTVPPGTGDEAERRIRAAGRADVSVVSAPEFLAEGTGVQDFLRPERLVFGGALQAARRVAALFKALPKAAPRILTSRRTAEMAKYAANTFLASRVSLVNEFANLCDAVGADVRDVARIVGLDSRIGSKFLRPGIGYGGSCFPKDVKAILSVAATAKTPMPVAEATDRTNQAQWRRVVATVQASVGPLAGKRIAVLGIAFKPGTDDTREAPGLRIAQAIADAGARVVAHDPVAQLPAGTGPRVEQALTAEAALDGADAAILVTEWPDYAALPWAKIRPRMRTPLLFDGRNALASLDLAAAGFEYRGIGIPAAAPSAMKTKASTPAGTRNNTTNSRKKTKGARR